MCVYIHLHIAMYLYTYIYLCIKIKQVTSGEYRMDEACELGDHPQGVYPAHTRVELRTLKVEFQKSA